MTCYLRLHEVLIGVSAGPKKTDWDAVFRQWQQATTVADREGLLDSMGLEAIDVYDLPHTDLSRFHGLVVSDRVDQEFLAQERDTVHSFLEDGKVVVFSGGLFRAWLPGGHSFVPVEDGEGGNYRPLTVTPHPIFAGVAPEDLGDAFAYGHHPLPQGAESLVSLPGVGAAVYLDEASTSGAMLVHAGHTLLGYAATEGAARRLVPQLLSWIREEATE